MLLLDCMVWHTCSESYCVCKRMIACRLGKAKESGHSRQLHTYCSLPSQVYAINLIHGFSEHFPPGDQPTYRMVPGSVVHPRNVVIVKTVKLPSTEKAGCSEQTSEVHFYSVFSSTEVFERFFP